MIKWRCVLHWRYSCTAYCAQLLQVDFRLHGQDTTIRRTGPGMVRLLGRVEPAKEYVLRSAPAEFDFLRIIQASHRLSQDSALAMGIGESTLFLSKHWCVTSQFWDLRRFHISAAR